MQAELYACGEWVAVHEDVHELRTAIAKDERTWVRTTGVEDGRVRWYRAGRVEAIAELPDEEEDSEPRTGLWDSNVDRELAAECFRSTP